MIPDLDPNVMTVRAVVTTRWKGNSYRPLNINSIESYYVDTALDNDADTWTFDMGDPNGIYLPMLKRDNEVRAQLYGVNQAHQFLMTGIADEVDFSETDGVWTLTGRDLSSLAVDSTPLPQRWAKARAWSIVKSQAHNIGFKDTNLTHTGIVKKSQYTDGSESYWDFWYRLFRQEKMWLWTTPNGILVGSKLAYGKDPVYFIGDARADDHDKIKSLLIPVIEASLTKSTQGRIEEVVVYGQRGNTGFNISAKDPTMHLWLKKPRKVMLDTDNRTTNAAKRAAWEEIFEGKVGSVELKITIPDPGFVIQQNKVARLYLKDIDLYGHYFVVGSRVQGGPDGFIQEIRLRELEYAVSRRVPTAPKLQAGAGPSGSGGSSLGKSIEQVAGMPHGWGDFFVKAAKKYHDNMDFSLFLACLMGICHVETGFENERQDGGPGGDHHIWHPFVAPTNIPNPGTPADTPGTLSKQEWQQQFANEPGTFGISAQMGVGPMQLTSIGVKQAADDLLKPGHRDQYAGGRWHPEHNIMIAGRTLHTDCQGTHATRDVDIWIAVDAYNRGVQGALDYFRASNGVSPYAQAVRKAVNSDPGYLAQVKSAIQATKDAQQAGKDGATSAADSGDVSPTDTRSGFPGFPSVTQIQKFFQGYSKINASAAEKRQAIWYAALWGAYHAGAINYLPQRPMRDMHGPPNVPGDCDCSQYATWCYESSGAPDPNALGYNGAGNTTTLWAHGRSTTYGALKPGDLVFYINPAHVGVYVGKGVEVEMGSSPGPLLMKVNYRSDIKGYRTYSTA